MNTLKKIGKGLLNLIPRFFRWMGRHKVFTTVVIIIIFLSYIGVVSIPKFINFVGTLWNSAYRFATEEHQSPIRPRAISFRGCQERNSCSRPTTPSRQWMPDNNQPQYWPQAQTAVVFETPVRNHSPRAQWVESVKMFRDESGFFITPPNLLMWDGDRGNMQWVSPFDEFAQFHPGQANRIAYEYGNSRGYEYWNIDGIVRMYGPEADPYRRSRRW